MPSFRVPKRFWSKVDVGDPSECWEWLAGRRRKRYGQFRIHEKVWQAHRVAWTLTYGKIPEGLYVCHKCDNRGCCNPYHLFLGTQQDNLIDARKKGHGVGSPKLTKADVLEIREMYAGGDWTMRELAEEYDVTGSHISKIVNRKSWAWLECSLEG